MLEPVSLGLARRVLLQLSAWKELVLLRITRTSRDGTIWLILEGKLASDWVEECETACATETAQGRIPALDLSEVTFVDPAGLRLLRQLTGQGVKLPKLSNFV